MMADDGRRLESLIQDLRKSTSRLDQLKILTRAWRVIKDLSPRERVEVATHVGLEEGLPLLEALGSPGGLSPATLARAVAKAERAHRGELDGILHNLRTPGERLKAVRKGLNLVESSLQEGEKSPAPPTPPTTPEPIPLQPRPAQPPPPAPAPQKRTEPTPAPAAVKPPDTPPPPVAAPAPPASAVLEKQTAPSESEARAEAAPPAKAETRPAPAGTAKGLESRWAAVTQPAALASPLPEPKPAVSVRKLTARFRDLHRLLQAGRLASDQVEPLLAGFPPGWPRRRALTALIRSGAVDDAEALLTEITRMERPMDEFWCLSALVHSHRLSESELEKAADRVRSPSSRRLLRRQREARR